MLRRLLATSVVVVSIFLGVLLVSVFLPGLGGPSDQAVAALANDLKSTFPNQIAETSWENAPPLDPPLIFIDFKRGLPDAELLAFLCEEIKLRVLAVHPEIEVLAGGWTLEDNCP